VLTDATVCLLQQALVVSLRSQVVSALLTTYTSSQVGDAAVDHMVSALTVAVGSSAGELTASSRASAVNLTNQVRTASIDCAEMAL
jgi:hypothetical protein